MLANWSTPELCQMVFEASVRDGNSTGRKSPRLRTHHRGFIGRKMDGDGMELCGPAAGSLGKFGGDEIETETEREKKKSTYGFPIVEWSLAVSSRRQHGSGR